MLHTVSFEGNLKNDPPPHPGEDQSPKRAKINEDQASDVVMEADQPLELGSTESHVPESLLSERVPETQMSPAPPSSQDVLMGDDNAMEAARIPSFKDKLLNSSEEEEEDIALQQGDVSIGLNGQIPTVNFATHVIDTLNKRMGLAVVVKLLGRKIGFRHLRSQLQSLWRPSGQIKLIDLNDDCFLVRFQEDLDYQNALLTGPWMIFGHYLTVQSWTPSFRPQDHVVNQVIGWIRLPKLPARYYHKSIIRSIGDVFGEVIKVDYNTDSGDRGKFARIAVVIDLTKPLTSKIQVDGELIFVEYEGLPSICFECGKYGHLQDRCPDKMVANNGAPVAINGVSGETTSPPEPNAPPAQVARETPQFGAWMQVQRQRRISGKGHKSNVIPGTSGNKKVVNGSRYEVLGDASEEERPIRSMIKDQVRESHYLNDDSGFRRGKVNHSKGPKRADTVTRQQTAILQNKNQDSATPAPQYVVRRSESSLDQSSNSAIRIMDPRMPRSSQAINSHKSGPNNQKPNGSKDPISRGRGIKISSAINLPNLGPRPNPEGYGTSNAVMKDLARSIRSELGTTDAGMQQEGVAIFVILEPRISGSKADAVIKKLGFHNSHRVESSGFSGGIWILWSSFVQINILVNHVQFVHMEVSCNGHNTEVLFTAIYGSPQNQYRKFLWQDLDHLADNISSPWVLADFQGIVRRIWGYGNDILSCIEAFKSEIQVWNSSTFGGIGFRKRRLLNRLNGIQSKLELNPNAPLDFLVDLEASLREELEDVCFQEELLWLQKSSSDRVCLGDRNTSYYHLKALMRKNRNCVTRLKLPDGTWLEDEDHLSSFVRQFFLDLYSLEDPCPIPFSHHGAFPPLASHQILFLEKPVVLEEVRQALFEMKPLKAPGALEWEAY
ncbi:hypothetical protein K1719_038979 [Acacia pycnantha]|nr:hypothetical protein K1719_038979 [Acacia pycnantha]